MLLAILRRVMVSWLRVCGGWVSTGMKELIPEDHTSRIDSLNAGTSIKR
jgi:hypothetical protein